MTGFKSTKEDQAIAVTLAIGIYQMNRADGYDHTEAMESALKYAWNHGYLWGTRDIEKLKIEKKKEQPE